MHLPAAPSSGPDSLEVRPEHGPRVPGVRPGLVARGAALCHVRRTNDRGGITLWGASGSHMQRTPETLGGRPLPPIGERSVICNPVLTSDVAPGHPARGLTETRSRHRQSRRARRGLQ